MDFSGIKQGVLQPLRSLRSELRLTKAARRVRQEDRAGLSASDPGIEVVVDACMAWLARAQDCSESRDGGIARDFSLLRGWSDSYPETSGYIIPTFISYAEGFNKPEFLARSKRVLDWLVSIQFPEGGFQGGMVGQLPRVPVTFNTGQILLGLAAGASRWPEQYLDSMLRAADWLANSLDDDGCWRKYSTPFASNGDKAYETHVSWGLLEAEKVAPGKGYLDAAITNIDWAIKQQSSNGWVRNCCLERPDSPLTHTLGYFLRGVIEGYCSTQNSRYLEAACLTAEGLLGVLEDDGRIPGSLASAWEPRADWVCLTGSVQIAHCWLLLWQLTNDRKYLEAGRLANQYVRRTIRVTGPDDIRGGVQGSFPVDGGYGKFQYLNWAAKFCVDSQLLELHVMRELQL